MKFITNMKLKNIFFHLLLPVKSVKSPPQTGQGESLCLESLQYKESSFQWWGYYARRWRSMPVDILTTKRKSICLERIQVREHIWNKENSFRLQYRVCNCKLPQEHRGTHFFSGTVCLKFWNLFLHAFIWSILCCCWDKYWATQVVKKREKKRYKYLILVPCPVFTCFCSNCIHYSPCPHSVCPFFEFIASQNVSSCRFLSAI